MSTPTEINIQWLSPAYAGEPPPVEVVTDLMGTTAGTTTIAAQPDLPARQITVGVLPVWGIALGWVLAIVLVAQAIKSIAKAIGFKERYPVIVRPLAIGWRKMPRHTWRRWMYVVPVGAGTVLSALFGPALGDLFGLRFGLWTSLLILGPGSGAAAAFAYDVLRGVVLPVLPTTVLALIERVSGVTLPDAVKEKARFAADTLDSEAYDSDAEVTE